MKLLFTKLQQEITTVKKSVTQVRVETGNADFKNAEFPVIELKPASQSIERTEDANPLRASVERRKTPLALSAKAEQVADIVDIQGMPEKGALNPVTYSARGALKARPYQQSFLADKYSSPDNEYSRGSVTVYSEPDERETFSAPDEQQARYHFTSRKFISTQEMIEYHTSKEKRLSFELTI